MAKDAGFGLHHAQQEELKRQKEKEAETGGGKLGPDGKASAASPPEEKQHGMAACGDANQQRKKDREDRSSTCLQTSTRS